MAMTPEQRTARARTAALAMHAKHDARKTTAKARAAFAASFESEAAKSEHYRTLAAASAKVRRANAQRRREEIR